MTTWFTSDLHFMHKNIVKFTNRGVDTNIEDHTDWLIQLWNSQVQPNDTIWHLGDFCFSTRYDDLAGIVRKLNGNKNFLKGNHDDLKDMRRLEQEGLINRFYDYKEIKIEKNSVCLFHFPISCWHKQGYGAFHLHGHSHGNFEGQGRILDVGLDSAYNVTGKHKFFNEEEILNYMNHRSIHVADHHKNREE